MENILDLERIIPLLVDIFRHDDRIVLACLFGSQIDASAYEKSDLDVAVLFKETENLWEEAGLESRLSEATGFDRIDLVNLNKAPNRFQFHVLASGRMIYEADREQVDEYLE